MVNSNLKEAAWISIRSMTARTSSPFGQVLFRLNGPKANSPGRQAKSIYKRHHFVWIRKGARGYLNIAKVRSLGVKGMAFTEHISELSRTSVEVCLHLMISRSLDVAWDRSREPGHLQTQVWA